MKEESDSSSSKPTDAVIFVGVSLVIDVACRHLFHGTRIPYSIALLVLGMALGLLEYGTGLQLGKIGDGICLCDNEIVTIVINESNTQGEEAKKTLEDLHLKFPQVLRTVKTGQVTHSMLRNLNDQIQNLENDGLLEEKVVLHLRHLVQTDLKKLTRNHPLVTMPKIRDVIKLHPFLGILPSMAQEALEGFMNGKIHPRQLPLYKEGSEPNCIWLMLISNGLVKCEGKRLTNIHSLIPTFSQGSILGLYEVLIKNPYICDMVTDSVVLCYYIETNNFLSVLRSSPGVEDLFWQKSALVIAKILLPQVVEKMSVQQLRAISADRSIVTTCTAGETIDT